MNSHLLPDPATDETLFSWITRYHYWSANSKIEESLEYLFNSPKRNVLLSNFLVRDRDDFGHFSKLLGWSFEKIISDFTPYYYEAIFNSSYAVGDMSRFSSSNIIPDVVDIHWRRKRQKKIPLRDGVALRLCPQCIKDDYKNYKFSYWHRCHQLPGVKSCHIHGSWLLSSCSTCNTPYCSHREIKLPSLECKCQPGAIHLGSPIQHSLEAATHFARLSAAPILTRCFPMSPNLLALFYQEQERARTSGNAKVGLKWDSARRMIDRFGIGLISDIHGDHVGIEDVSDWVIELRAGRSQPSYQHFLLIGSLFDNFNDFKSQYFSFLNELERKEGALPTTTQAVKEQTPIKAKLTVPLAREQLTQLMEQDGALTRSGLSKKDRRLYKFLCTSDSEWFRETLPTKTVRRYGSLAGTGRVSTIEGDRSRLLELIELNPLLNTTDLKKRHTQLYKRMLVRDRQWLGQTLSESVKPVRKVDSDDVQRAELVNNAVRKILEVPGRPVKVEISEIMKIMGERRDALVGVNSVLTKKAVYDALESPEEYLIRLCNWAMDSLSKDGAKINFRNVEKKLNRCEYRAHLRSLIKNKIKEYSQEE